MSVISLYATNPKVRNDLLAVLVRLNQQDLAPIQAEHFTSFPQFLKSGRENPRRILLLAQEGSRSVELAATIVEECPHNPLIWLSDLDFALFSYRLEVEHFGLLPGTEESLRVALHNCKHKQREISFPIQSEPVPVGNLPFWQKLLAKGRRIFEKIRQ